MSYVQFVTQQQNCVEQRVKVISIASHHKQFRWLIYMHGGFWTQRIGKFTPYLGHLEWMTSSMTLLVFSVFEIIATHARIYRTSQSVVIEFWYNHNDRTVFSLSVYRDKTILRFNFSSSIRNAPQVKYAAFTHAGSLFVHLCDEWYRFAIIDFWYHYLIRHNYLPKLPFLASMFVFLSICLPVNSDDSRTKLQIVIKLGPNLTLGPPPKHIVFDAGDVIDGVIECKNSSNSDIFQLERWSKSSKYR